MTKEEYGQRLDSANKIVFFGGAGVSTESGIPDFRSVDGLYSQKYSDPPETILSHEYFFEHTEEFYRFYYDKMIYSGAKPNKAHVKLAEWERAGKLTAVVTQNIDGLHQDAGSKNVLELHGTVKSNTCTHCGKKFSLEDILKQKPNVPHCDCGGVIKPDVTLYGEMLPSGVIERAIEYISRADLLIVGGTSLAVYPAAGLIGYVRGGLDDIIVINKSVLAGLPNQLNGNIGELL